MGLRPLPRIPTSLIFLLHPIPLHSLALRSAGGGWGSENSPVPYCKGKARVGCSSLFPQKEGDSSGDGKGAMVLKTMRPVFLWYLCMHTAVQQRSGKGLIAEAEMVDETKERGQGVKAKRFLGCGCRQGIPTSDTPPQPQTKTLNPSTSAKCILGTNW